MSNSLLTLSVDQTAIAIGTPVALGATPLLGSAGATNGGRKVRWSVPVLPGATGTPSSKIQTAPRIDPLTGIAPASGSASWTDLFTVVATMEQQGECTPDYWVRWNTTANHAADPLVKVYLTGVQ
jgi:acyl dehydratase